MAFDELDHAGQVTLCHISLRLKSPLSVDPPSTRLADSRLRKKRGRSRKEASLARVCIALISYSNVIQHDMYFTNTISFSPRRSYTLIFVTSSESSLLLLHIARRVYGLARCHNTRPRRLGLALKLYRRRGTRRGEEDEGEEQGEEEEEGLRKCSLFGRVSSFQVPPSFASPSHLLIAYHAPYHLSGSSAAASSPLRQLLGLTAAIFVSQRQYSSHGRPRVLGC